jgi:hypothetical protein
MSSPPSRALRALLILAPLSLLAGLAIHLYGSKRGEAELAGPGAHSRSALGHAAFAELLRELGHSVHESRTRSVQRTTERGLLVFAEPDPSDERALAALAAACAEPVELLLVLPRYRGTADPEHPEWIESASKHSIASIAEILSRCGLEARVRRFQPAEDARWTSDEEESFELELDEPQLLARSFELESIVAEERGILVAAHWRAQVESWLWIVADPDLVANRGLGRGENAELAASIVSRALLDEAPVVFDQQIHGAAAAEDLASSFGQWPLVLLLVHVLLLGGWVLWTALPRFGRARDGRAQEGRGLAVLVDGAAELLLRGDHARAALALRWDQVRREVLEHLRAPALERTQAQVLWLERAEKQRSGAESAGTLDAAVRRLRLARHVPPEEILELARRLGRWREELIDGDRGNRRARPSPA